MVSKNNYIYQFANQVDQVNETLEAKMRNKLRNQLLLILCSIAIFAVSASISAQSGSIVIKAKKIYTVTRGTLENGEILIERGKIREVGRKVNAPAGAREFNAEVVIPGMIDAHTHMSLSRGSGRRTPGPVTAEWKSVDHFNPQDPMIPIVLSGGMTSAITRSGSGIISSGQSVAIKLKNSPEKDMVLKPYVDLKMAVRSLINLRPGQTPATNMGWYATASDYFRRAKAYIKKIEDYEAGKIPQRPKKDERLEAFAAALRGEEVGPGRHIQPCRRQRHRLDESTPVHHFSLGCFAILLVLGGAFIWWAYGGGAALVGVSCLLSFMALFGLYPVPIINIMNNTVYNMLHTLSLMIGG